MGNDIEQARLSNMEEDKASSPNKGKSIDVGNDSDIKIAIHILEKLDTEVRLKLLQQNGSESRTSECCIYRVTRRLRNVYREAYAPQLISIGPLHRQNKRLQAMEKEKLEYFEMLTERDGMDTKKMREIVIHIKNQEGCLRHCYSEKPILMESNDFIEMILLDVVFIIQFFLELNDQKAPKIFDSTMQFEILEDLALLENQLPLFIIQEIYDRINPCSQDAKANLLDLATCFFRKYECLKRERTSPGVEGSKHFTDLLRNLMLGGAIMPSKNIFNSPKFKHSAVSLRKAGVRFQATGDKCLVNIIFDEGVLKIPTLVVDHNFERRVRNIMAMELRLYEHQAYICSYIMFMDTLIDSAEDVGLLVENNIIVNRLCDDAAVSNMINHFCDNIRFINSPYFGDISQRLNAHFENRLNRLMATLALEYLPSIWRSAATILLILTFIQTISSVISLF